MRLTIIRPDATVIVNGRAFSGLDMSTIPENIHAIQVYGDKLETEYNDGTPLKASSYDGEYKHILDEWQALADEEDRPLTKEEQLALDEAIARWDRNNLLREADILINIAEDSGIDASALREYRQKLREVPTQKGFPYKVTWPKKPQ